MRIVQSGAFLVSLVFLVAGADIVTFADHARRYLATLAQSDALEGASYEKNEGNEKSGGIEETEEAPDVWWTDSPAAVAPIVWSPPRECYGPIACARLGPCENRAAGRPCRLEGD